MPLPPEDRAQLHAQHFLLLQRQRRRRTHPCANNFQHVVPRLDNQLPGPPSDRHGNALTAKLDDASHGSLNGGSLRGATVNLAQSARHCAKRKPAKVRRLCSKVPLNLRAEGLVQHVQWACHFVADAERGLVAARSDNIERRAQFRSVVKRRRQIRKVGVPAGETPLPSLRVLSAHHLPGERILEAPVA